MQATCTIVSAVSARNPFLLENRDQGIGARSGGDVAGLSLDAPCPYGKLLFGEFLHHPVPVHQQEAEVPLEGVLVREVLDAYPEHLPLHQLRRKCETVR